jgi:hypothetical protein
MSGDQDSRTDIFKDESSRLKDALKSCRNVVANYRAMLSGDDDPADGESEDKSQTD